MADKGLKYGFTILELILVVAALTILAGLVMPVIRNIMNDARATKIVETVNILKKVIPQFKADTGSLPGPDSFFENRNGTLEDFFDNWQGPYLNRPWGRHMHPYGDKVYMCANGSKWDLDADGTDETIKQEFTIGFLNVPTDVAQLVDSYIDEGVSTDTVDWDKGGRVVVYSNWGGSEGGGMAVNNAGECLWILVYSGKTE